MIVLDSHIETLIDAFNVSCQKQQTITFIEGEKDEVKLSFSQLKKNALTLLAHFQDRNLQQGDELIIFLKNNQRFIEIFWACILGGIVPVPVAIGISEEHRSKLFKIFSQLKRPNIYLEQDNLERLQKHAEQHNLDSIFTTLTSKAFIHNEIKFSQVEPSKIEIATSKPQDTAFIQFSSGSTSDPKGVVLTHQNIITNIKSIGAGSLFQEDDCSFSWMPLTHDMGLIGFHINMLVWNIRQCIMATDLFSRRPLLWLQKASEHKASLLCSPNFGYKHYLKALGVKEPEIDLSAVRLIYNGAEPISVDTCESFLDRLAPCGLKHNSMFPVYGLAEATLAVAFPKPSSDYRTIHVNRHNLSLSNKIELVSHDHPDACSFVIEGCAVDQVQLKITDLNNNTLEQDCIGEIQMKGPNVTQGYYLNEQANATTLTGDGWLNTGDLGFIHNDELVVTGRTKEIIFVNGQNYFPHDLENIVIQNTSVELGKITIASAPNSTLQKDEILAFIFFRQASEDFETLADEICHLINHQTGLVVDAFIPVKRIPKTTSGKVQRRLLVDDYLAGEYSDSIYRSKQNTQEQSQESSSSLTPLQQTLLEACNSVLTENLIQADENFFDAGISSLALAEMHEKIDEMFPNLVDVTDFFEHQTVIEVAEFITNKLES